MIEACPYERPTAKTVCSIEGLLYFTWEREVIHVVKERGGETPYTSDPVFQKYKFTNIHRRDDRVSKWIIKEIINLNLKNDDLWFSLLIARIVNWPPTLEKLIYEDIIGCDAEDFDPVGFVKTIENFKKESSKVYSGAYMIYPGKHGYVNKSDFLANVVLKSAVDNAIYVRNVILGGGTIKSVVHELTKCFGISTFMAGQVVADLTYAKGHLDKADDLYNFAPMGPGSMRGLNYLLGRTPFAGWEQDSFNTELSSINNNIQKELKIVDLTLHDVQNIMCEYSKYCRVVLDEGVPKTLYKPETEF